MLQFKDTLNPLQPSWNPSQISRVGPKTGADPNAQPGGIRKDGVYAPHWARVHASDPNLNPQIDGRFVMYDVVDFDTDGFVSGQAQIDRLIVPVTLGGIYLVLVMVDTGSSANNMVQGVAIVVNGTVLIGNDEVQEQGSSGGSLNAMTLWQLNDGDYVQVRYQDTGGDSKAYFKVAEPGTPSLAILRIGG